jgi:phosphoribosylanthranilate isomerase
MYLFDTVGVNYGGTGVQFDWTMLEKVNMGKPYFLSGGVGLEDSERVKSFAVKQHELFAVDVNSKFEISPGVKDMEMIEKFCKRIRNKE